MTNTLTFTKVYLKNFGSWPHATMPLKDRGLVLVQGPTGAGKSTLFRAIHWCLFGKTPEGHLAAEVVRQGSEKNYTCVRVRFTLGTDEYTVARYRNHPVFKSKATIEGPNLPAVDADSTVKDVNKLITQVLGIDERVFTKTLYFVQRDAARFPSLTDTQQKTLLEHITDLRLVVLCEEIVKERLASLRAKTIAEEKSLALLDETVAGVEDEVQEREGERLNQIKKLHKSIRIGRKKLKALRAQTESKQEEMNALLGGPITEVNLLRPKVANWHQALDDWHNLEKKGICPTCGATLSKRVYAEHTQNLVKQIQDGEARIKELQVNEYTYQDLKNELQEYQSESIDMQARIEQLTYQVSDLEAISSKSKVLDDLREQRKESSSKLKKYNARLPYYEFWRKGFGSRGLRAFVLTDIVKTLQDLTNSYIYSLGYDAGLQVSYTMQDNYVVQRYYGDRTYATLSGGERQVVDLCTGLALRDVAEWQSPHFIDCLILDEPFEGLDGTLRARVHTLLDRLGKSSIFLISHADIDAGFSKQYHVEKSPEGVSHFV